MLKTQRIFDVFGHMWSLIPTGEERPKTPCVGLYDPQGNRVAVLCEKNDRLNRSAAYGRYVAQHDEVLWPADLKNFSVMCHFLRLYDKGRAYRPGGDIAREHDAFLVSNGYLRYTNDDDQTDAPVILANKGYELMHDVFDQISRTPHISTLIAGRSFKIGMWAGIYEIVIQTDVMLPITRSAVYHRCGIEDVVQAIQHHLMLEFGEDMYTACEEEAFEQIGLILRQRGTVG